MKKYFILTIILSIALLFAACSKGYNNSNSAMLKANEVSFVMSEFDENNLTEPESKIVESEILKNQNWLAFLNSNNLQTVSSENDSQDTNLGFFGNKLDWTKQISKFDILSYLKLKNISIANMSELDLDNDENGNTKTIIIANKNISAEDFVKNFKMLSNRIKSVEISSENIIFYGNGFGINPQINLNLA